MNSNYMPHMLYKNTDLYSLSPTLARIYNIYVDKETYKGHIIWNPNTMTINDYAQKFMNNDIPMESYEFLFGNEFDNELSNEKSYIRYNKTNEEKEETRDIKEDIIEEPMVTQETPVVNLNKMIIIENNDLNTTDVDIKGHYINGSDNTIIPDNKR